MFPKLESNNALNGSPTLTLTFDKVIAGLTAADITISAGDTGAVKGELMGSGPAYTLGLTGVTKPGAITVTVSKKGYEINPSFKTVTVTQTRPLPPRPDYRATSAAAGNRQA